MSLRLLTFTLFLLPLTMHADNKDILTELDNTIDRRGDFIKAKEDKIALLKQQTRTERDSIHLLKLYDDIYSEYYVFKFDSAMVYAEKGYQLAVRQDNLGYINRFQLHRSQLLSISGLYSEALDILNSIDSTTVAPDTKFRYYFAYFTLYSYKTTFSDDSTYAPRYRAIAREYLVKAIDHLSEKYLDYMVKASMCDLKCATMENSALQEIAIRLYEQGDIERADHYINVSMEDAKFYNNRLRMIQISRILPQIVSTYQTTIKAQNKYLTYALVFISLLVIGLLATAFYIHRQNRLLTIQRKELADNNQQLTGLNQQLSGLNGQLHQLNEQLVDTNKKREGLASIYIDLCAKYIDKLSKYQTLVKRKIKANQAQELLQAISSTRISEEDAATFLHRFDKAFLELYPTFVDEFNAMFPEESRIQLKSPTTLTTELRTFALIRLGVKNTADIAGLLFLSTQTIYNCRSVVKNKALNKERVSRFSRCMRL